MALQEGTKRNIIRGILGSFFALAVISVYLWGADQRPPSVAALQEASAANAVAAPPAMALSTPVPLTAPKIIQPETSQAGAVVLPAPVDDGKIHAAAAVSVDAASGAVLFGLNQEKQLPVASLTKLMTALVVFQNYNLDQPVVISQNAMAQEGVQGVLKLGETLAVRNLLYIALIESSNRAAYALSEVMGPDNFVAAMNENAKILGLENTHFADASGLSSGSYSTAADIAKLSAYLLKQYPLFGQIIGLKEYDLYAPDGSFHHQLQTTNQLLGQLGIVSGKTGYTTEARGCFMAIRQDGVGNYSINVILGAEDRFLEMKKLIAASGL